MSGSKLKLKVSYDDDVLVLNHHLDDSIPVTLVYRFDTSFSSLPYSNYAYQIPDSFNQDYIFHYRLYYYFLDGHCELISNSSSKNDDVEDKFSEDEFSEDKSSQFDVKNILNNDLEKAHSKVSLEAKSEKVVEEDPVGSALDKLKIFGIGLIVIGGLLMIFGLGFMYFGGSGDSSIENVDTEFVYDRDDDADLINSNEVIVNE